MRIFHVLDKIENSIYNSPKVPLSNYSLVRRDKIINVIEKTRQNLPEEMKQARWVSKENERIIQDSKARAAEIIHEAEKRADGILKAAKEESKKLLDKERVVVNAKERAEEVLNDAQGKADEMVKNAEYQSNEMVRKARREAEVTRGGADEYALRVLTGMEGEFTRILDVIKKSKAALLPRPANKETEELPKRE